MDPPPPERAESQAELSEEPGEEEHGEEGLLQEILGLFASVGYEGMGRSFSSPLEEVVRGLAWCIAATSAPGADIQYEPAAGDQKTKIKGSIEAALRSMGCPHPLQTHQIQRLDYRSLYPVVQWVVGQVLTTRAGTRDAENITVRRLMESAQPRFELSQRRPCTQHPMEELTTTTMSGFADKQNQQTLKDESLLTQKATSLLHEIEEGDVTLQKLEMELSQTNQSISMLQAALIELDQRKADLLNDKRQLHLRFKDKNSGDTVRRLISLLELLKVLEKQESDIRLSCKQKCAQMQSELVELEKDISVDNKKKVGSADFDKSLGDASEKLNSAKRELAAKLRAIMSLKRQLGDVPVQSELIQYEHRFSELYVQIQEKLQQTRKFYATYNALLEIKELMLKEVSLLNSISSQFREAITSTTGRSKLIDSMEVILNGTQQKLNKVELSLHAEQKIRDSLKEKYSSAIAEQHHFSSLLKAFQEECAKNERLWGVIFI